MNLVATLEAGRREFLEATASLTSEQACAKPSGTRWSVLECIEHVIIFEDRYLEWLLRARTSEARRDHDRELRLFMMIRSRLTKVESPQAVRPLGRFTTLPAALAKFNAVRDRTVQFVQERGDSLWGITVRHPFFGQVNGAEMVQLIDGHARRHADQIRENCEGTVRVEKTPSKAVRGKKAPGFKRDVPDLPAEFETLEAPESLFEHGDFISIEDQRITGLQRAEVKVEDLRIEGSLLEQVHLPGARFASAVWRDVRLVGCDLSNVRVHRISLLRVEFIDCKLTGFTTTAAELQDVLIQRGDARYAQLQGARFRTCEFDGCNWQDADLQNAELSGSVFRSCNLARTDFQGARLQNTDLRTSEVEGMVAGIMDLRGAIVDPPQAMIFAKLLGLQIC